LILQCIKHRVYSLRSDPTVDFTFPLYLTKAHFSSCLEDAPVDQYVKLITSLKSLLTLQEQEENVYDEDEVQNRSRQSPGFEEEDVPNTDLRDQLARKLVRYALSCEYSRKPIKRLDITAKILGSHSRQFKPVFTEAQIMLQNTFGMKLVELPKQEKVTLAQKRGRSMSYLMICSC
jgi:hypothetical protein